MTRSALLPSTLPSYVGMLSVAFGFFDFLNAAKLARRVGMSDDRIFKAAGIREIVTGAGAIASPTSAAPMVGRLMGDAADLAVLGRLAFRKTNPGKRAAAVGVAVVIAVTALDIVAKRQQAAGRAS